jgi:hypothetical protein
MTMYDIVSPYVDADKVRDLLVITLVLSALMIFFLAFAVTRGAGFRCPLAVLRAVQRFFSCALAITLAYIAAYVAEYSTDSVPLGPLLIVFILVMVSALISGARHLMAPAIADDNTWGGAWRLFRERMLKPLPASHQPRMVRPVR